MANWRNVRVTNAHGIYREDTQHPETGQHYTTHVTGFDRDGNAVRPIHAVPDTAGVRSALNETRLEEVRDADVETIKTEHEEERRRVAASRPSSGEVTTITLSPEDLQARLVAAAAEAQSKGKGADPTAIAAAHVAEVQTAQGVQSANAPVADASAAPEGRPAI